MIRRTVLVLAFSTTSVYAQNASNDVPTDQDIDQTAAAISAAEEEGVTGFVPLVAPALGAAAAAVGLAAAGGGGSSTPTTSTVSTN